MAHSSWHNENLALIYANNHVICVLVLKISCMLLAKQAKTKTKRTLACERHFERNGFVCPTTRNHINDLHNAQIDYILYDSAEAKILFVNPWKMHTNAVIKSSSIGMICFDSLKIEMFKVHKISRFLSICCSFICQEIKATANTQTLFQHNYCELWSARIIWKRTPFPNWIPTKFTVRPKKS